VCQTSRGSSRASLRPARSRRSSTGAFRSSTDAGRRVLLRVNITICGKPQWGEPELAESGTSYYTVSLPLLSDTFLDSVRLEILVGRGQTAGVVLEGGDEGAPTGLDQGEAATWRGARRSAGRSDDQGQGYSVRRQSRVVGAHRTPVQHLQLARRDGPLKSVGNASADANRSSSNGAPVSCEAGTVRACLVPLGRRGNHGPVPQA
jgi:hypothetical protein